MSWRADGFFGGEAFDLRADDLLGILRKIEAMFPTSLWFVDQRDVVVDLLTRPAGRVRGWAHWASGERELGNAGRLVGGLRWSRRDCEPFREPEEIRAAFIAAVGAT